MTTEKSDSQFSKVDFEGCGCKLCKTNRRLGWIQALMWVKSMFDYNIKWWSKPGYHVKDEVEKEIQNA